MKPRRRSARARTKQAFGRSWTDAIEPLLSPAWHRRNQARSHASGLGVGKIFLLTKSSCPWAGGILGKQTSWVGKFFKPTEAPPRELPGQGAGTAQREDRAIRGRRQGVIPTWGLRGADGSLLQNARSSDTVGCIDTDTRRESRPSAPIYGSHCSATLQLSRDRRPSSPDLCPLVFIRGFFPLGYSKGDHRVKPFVTRRTRPSSLVMKNRSPVCSS